MIWCKCKICDKEITPEDRFKLVSGWVTCTTHTTHERNDLRRTDSWAEDNKVEAAAPAVERSK